MIAASLGACDSLLDIDEPDAPVEGENGWVFFTSSLSGTVELWAAPDSGGDGVRITDGMTDRDNEWLHLLPPTRDGRHVGVVSRTDPSGVVQRQRHLWVMEIDGASLRHVAQITDDTDFYGISWEGNGPGVVYAGGPKCAEDLWHLDVDDGSEPTLMLPFEGAATHPRVNPQNPDEVFFWDTDCGERGQLTRLGLESGALEVVDATGARQGGHGQWSSDGTLFAYGFASAIYVHDMRQEFLVYQDEDASAKMHSPYFGNGDTRVYVKRCTASACGLASIELATGRLQELHVEGIGSDLDTDQIVGWAPFTTLLDDDGDGLANGID